MFKFLIALAATTAITSIAHASGATGSSQRITEITARHGDLQITFSDGRIMTGDALKGAVLTIAGMENVQVANVERDPDDRLHEIRLFDLRQQNEDGEWESICKKGYDGQASALLIGDNQDPTKITVTCTSGNYGKCTRFGYAPWRTAPDGRPMALWHAACLKMLPAEYGGDGVPHTVNGTRIDMFDSLGINLPETDNPMPFEAGWTPGGAVCVAHARVPKVSTLTQIETAYPALPAGPANCTEERARRAGALIFNRSMVQ